MLINLFLLLLLVFILALAATFFLHLVILRVPYIPSGKRLTDAMVEMAQLRTGQSIIDLGAGDGELLRAACKAVPGVQATGVEYVPTIWLLGWIWLRLTGYRARWILGDALKADVSKADVVFLYVGPRLMEQLEEKFDRELRPGTVVISNTFTFPHRVPLDQRKVGPVSVRRYVW